ncbi:MAG: hypothetical protein SGI83_01070 [Bacteroidota bacterium]|nr:hypothetical protein [Bacteroidota bacterium]
MQKFLLLVLVATLIIHNKVKAQPFDKLVKLQAHSATVYHSSGYEQRAVSIAERMDKAIAYYIELLSFSPVVTLLILDTADWKKYTTSGAVYGMPHFDEKRRLLFVAASDNPFWKSFLPPLEKLPSALRNQVESVYKKEDSLISMEAFFDLLALHELGHAFHMQAGLTMQRKWLGELFVNILLHSYIAGKEPASLPALTLFPKMVIGNGVGGFKYTRLADIEERYDEIGRDYPNNYGWYQCRWHSAAAIIYDTAGKLVGKRIWEALSSQKERLSDEQLLVFLATAEQAVAAMVTDWDRDIIR